MKRTVTQVPVLLGTGILTWMRNERVSDRYGTVYLLESGNSQTPDVVLALLSLPQFTSRATLIAEVVEIRKSTHIGDLFRGVYPKTPQVGEVFILGHGTPFSEGEHGNDNDPFRVGLRPSDGRQTDWLDIHSLYRVHEQTVELYLVAALDEIRLT